MLAKAVIFVETTFADVDTLAVAIDNVPRFGAKIFALLTEFATVMLAILAEGISYRRGTGGGYQFFGIGWYKGGNRQSHDFHGEPIDDFDTPF